MNPTALLDPNLLSRLQDMTIQQSYLLDLNKKVLLWIDERALAFFGYSWNDILAMGSEYFETVLHTEDRAHWEGFLERAGQLKDGQSLILKYRFKDNSGTYHWVHDRVSIFERDPSGKPKILIGTAWDSVDDFDSQQLIAEAKAQLISSAKMAALGEMSGGIAHEINNPLTVIQARAFQLQQMVDLNRLEPEKIKQAAESISRTADKIAKIIKSLRSFAREGAQDAFELAPVSQIINETLEFCRTRFYNYGVEVEVSTLNPDLEIECRLIQIEQVLLNLLNNSFDAIQALDEKWVRISVEEFDQNVEICVVDSGKGIPKDIAKKIMLPFFTTKEIGKGTGLGLSISKEIIKSHQGELLVKRDTANTTFCIRLPKWQK